MKEGWEYKTLGEICDLYQPKTISTKEMVSDGLYDVFGANGKIGKYYSYNHEHSEILMTCRGATCGNINISTPKSWINGNAMVVHIKDEGMLDRQFLVYSLIHIDKTHIITGSAQPQITRQTLSPLQVCFPSLSEQQSIVDYLDSAFAKIDAMKANAEKALNEAKALFQASLKEMFEPKEGWKEKKLGDICEIIRGKRFVRADIVKDGVPCIHYGDIYTHYGLSVTKTKGCVNPELAKKLRFANKNDVIVVQAGENNWDIGVGVAYFGEKPAVVHDACFILRHKQDPMFISYYLRSYNYHRYLVDYVHEGKICSFLKPALENAPFPLPPLSEQQSIVAILDSIKSKVDRLQENYDKISQECDALKQAILRQVFE